ncbi:hypothetical protein DPMN_162622 [Dreissena polymorpha]|uniref:Uncharacterized protein n=1 Tax=Dreissena polymorpha TaxID=45954 RepID=A0A9D4EPW2_DREPO|nr:hypothetical protein DPMN_162622 [Dreissena polymorpha]
MNRLLNSRLFLLNVKNCGIANQSLASFRVAKYLHLENKLRVYAVSSSATKTLKHSSGAKHTSTHTLLPHRQYSSNEWEDDPRKKQGDNNKPRSDDEDTAVPRVSFIYSYKFLFLFVTKHRELIKICLDSPSFFSGLKRAFFFVTDCLSKKDIDDLQDVVADELLAKIKAEPASIYSKSCGSTYAVKCSDLMFVTLTGLRPLENPKNGNRYLTENI